MLPTSQLYVSFIYVAYGPSVDLIIYPFIILHVHFSYGHLLLLYVLVLVDKYSRGSFFKQGFISQEATAANLEFGRGVSMSSRIPQVDGPTPDPYDDALSTPNVSRFFYKSVKKLIN